jgi:serine/threonine protein kinase
MPSSHPPETSSGSTMRPTSMVEGTRVGSWRVLWRYGTGTFGVVYLAVRVGEEAAGPYALKLARARGDARFGREAELLSRVRHANVPRLQGQGEWYGLPYVVMDWVEGVALYRWTLLCNPSWRQVARVLSKVAGALAAVHSVGGTHRDMKGDNIRVRHSDGEPVLTDFGACTWEGAAPLTVGGPPGTPLYYSPERLRSHLGLLPPGAPSGAGPADDVYGLGVTAFRLLTDSYPFLEVDEAQRTQERLAGKPPRSPHELNASVPPELGALVLRMMAARPEERPPAHEVARTLEALALAPAQAGEEPLFVWETEPSQLGPGRRLKSRMEYERWLVHARIEEGQSRVAAEVGRVQAQRHVPLPPQPKAHVVPHRASVFWRLRTLTWHSSAARLSLLVVAGTVLLTIALWLADSPPSEQHEKLIQQTRESRNAGTTGLGDTPLSAPESASAFEPARGDIGAEMPKNPLPGQLQPPCKRPMVELQGGCWVGPIEDELPPCGKQTYAWATRCYRPIILPQQPTTSDPP